MDKEKELISVITIVYNGASDLERTIQSVINQSYQRIEYIIIDGGSTDGSVDIIRKYEDKIAYWVSEPDGGIYYAMNKGIDRATGTWINFMNSGDCFYNSDVVASIFNERDLSRYEYIYGNTQKFTATGNSISIPNTTGAFWKGLPIHQSIFSRTTLNRKYKFDTSFRVSADFDFTYKVFFFKHATLYIDTPVSTFNMIGFSHHNRYLGFSEDRRIALKYKGNRWMSCRVYVYYIFITLIGKTIDILKKYTPGLYSSLKKLKNQP